MELSTAACGSQESAMPPAVPDWTACDFDRSQLPASRAAVFGETADVGNKTAWLEVTDQGDRRRKSPSPTSRNAYSPGGRDCVLHRD